MVRKVRRTARAKSEAQSAMSRSEALLAQLLLHSMGSAGQTKKALALRTAGLSNSEIAGLLGTTPAVVGQVLYQARRSRGAQRGARVPKRRRK